jgi:pSer/pThr/pTyr-binding forkhead associated (FHA) protein
MSRVQTSIRLRNENAADQVWEVPLVPDVIVGRNANCKIVLTDKSVSRPQCRIYLNGAVMIENLSNSNITQLNGLPLNKPAKLKVGDRMKLGRVTLIVDAVVNTDIRNKENLNNFNPVPAPHDEELRKPNTDPRNDDDLNKDTRFINI